MHGSRKLVINIAVVIFYLVSIASNLTTAEDNTPAASQQIHNNFLAEQLPDQIRADQVLGVTVLDLQGDVIGLVTDLIFDRHYALHAIVVSVGGFMGFGAKLVAIPKNKLHFMLANSNSVAVTNITQNQVANAPDFLNDADVIVQRQIEWVHKQQQRQRKKISQQLKFEG